MPARSRRSLDAKLLLAEERGAGGREPAVGSGGSEISRPRPSTGRRVASTGASTAASRAASSGPSLLCASASDCLVSISASIAASSSRSISLRTSSEGGSIRPLRSEFVRRALGAEPHCDPARRLEPGQARGRGQVDLGHARGPRRRRRHAGRRRRMGSVTPRLGPPRSTTDRSLSRRTMASSQRSWVRYSHSIVAGGLDEMS